MSRSGRRGNANRWGCGPKFVLDLSYGSRPSGARTGHPGWVGRATRLGIGSYAQNAVKHRVYRHTRLHPDGVGHDRRWAFMRKLVSLESLGF